MAKKRNPSSKGRKKRPSLVFKTPSEVKRARAKILEKTGDVTSQHEDGNTALSNHGTQWRSNRLSVSKSENSQRNSSGDDHESPSSSKENRFGNLSHDKRIRQKLQSAPGEEEYKSPAQSSRVRNKASSPKPHNPKTQTKRRKQKSINFFAAKDRKSKDKDQSVTGHTLTKDNALKKNNLPFHSSVSSIDELSDIAWESEYQSSCKFSGASKSLNEGSNNAGQKRKLKKNKGGQSTSKQNKRHKSKDDKEASSFPRSFTSGIKTMGAKSNAVALDRILDLNVSKKTFAKWKPLSKSTIEFVDKTLKSVVLNVISETEVQRNEAAIRCLEMFRQKVMGKLPNLKAPSTQGDFTTMATQNKLAENTFLEKTRELNLLERRLEEEQSLLDSQTLMIEEYTRKLKESEEELKKLESEKAHPVIEKTAEVLKLPKLLDDFAIEEEEEEANEETLEEEKLRETLLQLRQKVSDASLEDYMEKLTAFMEELP